MKILKTVLKYGSNATSTEAKANSLLAKISNETPRELRNKSPANATSQDLTFKKTKKRPR